MTPAHLARVRGGGRRRDHGRAADPRARRPCGRDRGAGWAGAVGRASGEAEMEAMRRALESGSVDARVDFLAHTETKPTTGRRDRAVHRHPDARARRRPRLLRARRRLLLRRPDPRPGSSIVPPAAGGGSLADYMRSLDDGRRTRRSTCSPRATAPGSPTRPRRSPSTPSTGSPASALWSPRSTPASARAPACSTRPGPTCPSRCARRPRSRCRRTWRSSRPRGGSTRAS